MVTIRRPLLLTAGIGAIVGVAPLWPWLDPAMRLLLPLALGGAVWGEQRGVLLPPRLATLLAGSGFLWYALQFRRSDIVAPAVHLLAVLLVMRLLTEKSGRNILQIFVLSLLALAASSLYSLSSTFVLFLILEVICIALGLMFLAVLRDDPAAAFPRPAFRQLLVLGLSLPLVSLLLVPPLFFLLPRTQFPLWAFLHQPETAVSGVTDRIEPGEITALASSRRIVLRAEGEELPRSELYWRAMVLNTPQGRAWVRRTSPLGEAAVPVGGRPVSQTLYVEASGDRYLPGLDAVSELSGVRAEPSGDRIYLAARKLEQRTRLRTTAVPGGKLQLVRPVETKFYLTLPEPLAPRLRAVALRIRDEGENDRGRLALVERFFLAQQLNYSMTELPGGEEPLDDFLFAKRSGYCEHFATAFVVLLRGAGVPARLVGGYYGGEYNQVGGYYLVSEDLAHVWVEVLLDGVWQRYDPTRLARNAEQVGTLGASHLRGVRQWVESLNYYWNRVVISYDLAQQVAWLEETGSQARSWRKDFPLRRLLLFLLAGSVLAGVFWGVKPLLRPPQERLVRRFLRQLQREGVDVAAPGAGLRTLAAQHPAAAARAFVERYYAIVFQDRRMSGGERRELESLLRQLKGGVSRRSAGEG